MLVYTAARIVLALNKHCVIARVLFIIVLSARGELREGGTCFSCRLLFPGHQGQSRSGG